MVNCTLRQYFAADAYTKLEMFLDRCIEGNIILKFAKTWIGQTSASFFGYECSYGQYKLSTTRIQALLDTPFPGSKKLMQSFLDAAVFFQSFVSNFADYAAPIFSDAATRWSVIEREYFACFWCVQQCQYYLRCKQFILQTDHRNLVWMESSDIPKIIRWCIFLQIYFYGGTYFRQNQSYGRHAITSSCYRYC